MSQGAAPAQVVGWWKNGIEVHLESDELRRSSKAFAAVIRNLLEAVVMANRIQLRLAESRGTPLPSIYACGVKFMREPRGTETFVDIRRVLERGGGDCAHLAAWRCAELLEQGENAAIAVEYRINRKKRSRVFHVVVRRENQEIEDPSLALGMLSPWHS